MDIRKWFGRCKEKAMTEVDRLIYDGPEMTKDEMEESRMVIASQFDDLLTAISSYEDTVKQLEADIRRDNELIRMLCKVES